MSNKKKIFEIVNKAIVFIISNLIFWRRKTIVIAGLGRSGTTLLYNSISNNHFYKKQDMLIKFNDQHVYKKGYIYKTHDYPPQRSLPSHVKIIFMYGNVYNTVISTHRKINEWSKQHHFHLSSESYSSDDRIYYKDILQFEKQFDSWVKTDYLKILYEKLYEKETQDRLASYLGFRVKMIKQRKRKSSFANHSFIEQIKETYKSLNDKINNRD